MSTVKYDPSSEKTSPNTRTVIDVKKLGHILLDEASAAMEKSKVDSNYLTPTMYASIGSSFFGVAQAIRSSSFEIPND